MERKAYRSSASGSRFLGFFWDSFPPPLDAPSVRADEEPVVNGGGGEEGLNRFISIKI